MSQDSMTIERLRRTNRRLRLALAVVAGAGAWAVLAGLDAGADPAEFVGIAVHDKGGFLYRMRADGSLERLNLEQGRVTGGTPAEWAPFATGRRP